MKNRFKLLSKLFIFSFLTLILAIFLPIPVSAQVQCWPQVRVDIYQCYTDVNPTTGEVTCRHEWNGNSVFDACNPDISQNPSCSTNIGRCTSADSCTNQGGTCRCSFSTAYCGVMNPGGTPPPGSTPVPGNTPPPGCTPSCSAPMCGQSNGCGGYCDSTDGQSYLATPIIKRPLEGPPVAEYLIDSVTGLATIEFRVSNQDFVDRFQVIIEHRPLDNSLAWSELTRFHFPATVGTLNTRYNWQTGDAAKYRISVRAKQPVCSANSPWSANRRFDVIYEAPSCTVTLPATAVAIAKGATSVDQTATVTALGGTVVDVTYAASNSAIAQVNTPTDSVAPYSTTVTGLSGGVTTLTATATVINGSGVTSTCTAQKPITVGEIAGRLCADPNGTATFITPCDPYIPEDNETISIYNNSGTLVYSGLVNAINGTFTFNVPPSSTIYRVRLSSSDIFNQVTYPGTGEYTGVTSPRTDLNFYYRAGATRDPWWQVMGGSIYGGTTAGTAIFSPIPDTCATSVIGCVANLLRLNTAATQYSSGVAVTGGGAIDSKELGGVQDDNINEGTPARNLKATGTSMDRYIENYDYFLRLFSMTQVLPADADWSSSASLSQPGNNVSPINGKRAYYFNGNASINNGWNVTSGRKIVVFVRGDLTINQQILVDTSSFVAFIVSGNIIISESVDQTTSTSTDSVLDGVYVANGSISVNGNLLGGDQKFVGAGTFVGHGGVSFARDFDDGGAQGSFNSGIPVVIIKYRPDFLINMPDDMKRPMYDWQEVVQ